MHEAGHATPAPVSNTTSPDPVAAALQRVLESLRGVGVALQASAAPTGMRLAVRRMVLEVNFDPADYAVVESALRFEDAA